MDGDTSMRVVYLGIVLASVLGWVVVEYRGRLGQAFRVAAAWGLILTGLAGGYGLWTDLRRDVVPQASVDAQGRLVLPAAPDGHYYVTVEVSGVPLRFMADTGASSVTLRREDAMALGLDPASLPYLGQAMTANGTVRTAHVTLSDIALGPFRDESLAAWVNEGEMDVSLLGMGYLGRFRIEIEAGRMILSR